MTLKDTNVITMTKNDLGTSCNYHYGKLFTEKVDTIVFKTILEEKKIQKHTNMQQVTGLL